MKRTRHDRESPRSARRESTRRSGDQHCLWCPAKIVSGGQTGVDRAGLDVAIQLGIQHGGWCPGGRLAEDGSVPSRYVLEEMPTRDYAARTLQNVIDSDATLILYRHRIRGGTLLTKNVALQHARPVLLVRLDASWEVHHVLDWLQRNQPDVLNIAGPRESGSPGIYDAALSALMRIMDAALFPR
ncbi:MAG: putative molybdenum carrier protein [Planctomycetota bacterium]